MVMRVTAPGSRWGSGGRTRLYGTFIAAFVFGALFTGGAVWASGNNTIYACVNPAGLARIVDTPGDCKQNETPLNWASGSGSGSGQQGPEGPAGPAGPQGETAPEGPAGPTGAEGPQGTEGSQGETGPEGPAGPTGPDGPIGPEGPTGPTGDAGVLRFYRVQASATAITSATAQAFCDDDDIVTGGGFHDVEPTSEVESNNPLNMGGVPTAWSVTVRGGAGANPDGFIAYAICADMTP